MVSSVMYRARWTAHSSFCSRRIAPTSLTIASSLRKMPVDRHDPVFEDARLEPLLDQAEPDA